MQKGQCTQGSRKCVKPITPVLFPTFSWNICMLGQHECLSLVRDEGNPPSAGSDLGGARSILFWQKIKPWLMTNNIVSIISDCHGLLTSIKKFCWFSCEGFPPFSVSLYCSNRSQLWTKSCFQMIPIHFLQYYSSQLYFSLCSSIMWNTVMWKWQWKM